MIISALATLVRASYLDGPPTEPQSDLWRELVCNARNEYDRLRSRLRDLEEENAHFRAAAAGLDDES